MPRRLAILLTVAGALAAFGLLLAIHPVRDAVSAAGHGDLKALRAQLDSLGGWAVLLLIGIALVHVVLPFPAEIPTAAAGFALGFAIAFPLMLVAWVISCLCGYGIARVAGAPALDRLAGAERMAQADRLVERGGAGVLVAVRLVPLIPYTLVSLAAGATRVPLVRFVWTTAVGIAPLTALTALLGQRLQSPRLGDPVLWLALAAVLLLVALVRPVGKRLRRDAATR
ncbi:MAG: hypothetical protein QOE28_505 [Solirubrobacteraceae bacterium]|nr:hypothetical protein [Solirubrobacteraceae bacterium]